MNITVHAAQHGGSQVVLTAVLKHSKSNDPAGAKVYLTARSHELYDRIYAHDLLFLLPDNTNAMFDHRANNFDYVRFMEPDISEDNKNQYVTMAFTTHENVKKLDLPETFRYNFGQNWREKVNMIEQSYLMAKQIYGAEKSAKMVEALIKVPPR